MLQFQNFTIRPLLISDLLAYYNLIERNRTRLEDFFTGTIARTKTINHTQEFLQDITAKREAKQYFPFVVEDDSIKQLIAFMDLKNIDWTIPKTEMGFYTDVSYAGKGITKQALPIFLNYCATHFGFKKVFLRTHHSNMAAQKLALGCGFELEGKMKMDYKKTSGEIVDLLYFGKIL